MNSTMSTSADTYVWLVVPMYNAADYLRPCLDSIRSQTFESFRVLLIDDGSTDATLEIAREYVALDCRFELTQLPHSGVSAARNYGIDHASGKYIGFVDADDCLHPRALEVMTTTLRETRCQVCIASFETGLEYHPKPVSAPTPRIFGYEEAMELGLYQKVIINSPWGLLIDNSLFDKGSRFREGIRYEDLDAFYRFYDGANSIAYLATPLYFYRQNSNSFMHRWQPARLDVLDVTDRMVEYMQLHHPVLVKAAEDRRFSAHFNMLLLMMAYHVDNPKAMDRCWQIIRKGRWQAIFNPKVRLKNKLGALLSFGGKSLLKFFARKD